MDPQMAQQMQMAQQLRAQPAPGQAALGSGMVQMAAQVMQSRPYQLHVQEAKSLGQQPMTPEQFMQSMQQPRQ